MTPVGDHMRPISDHMRPVSDVGTPISDHMTGVVTYLDSSKTSPSATASASGLTVQLDKVVMSCYTIVLYHCVLLLEMYYNEAFY